MKKISLKGLDACCYQEVLDNGLEVYMLPFENKKNYFISYATRFGSEIVEFLDDNGRKIKPPLGIAHFLEHKMFEQEDGIDPFTFFSGSGTDSNASTTFDNTQYICYGTKEFSKNLRYLLQFVNSPYYTDTNVNKEKGIIAEEIKMYQDIPDFQLEMKLRECVYHNHPRRTDIAGTVEEINKITKEDLYDCYNSFYVPNNMFVLIVGNFSIDDALTIIKEELSNKPRKKLPKIISVIESINVMEKDCFIKSNIDVPKIAIGLKIPTKNLSMKGIELDLYLHMLTNILFGSSSEFRERVRRKKLLNGLSTEWEVIDGFVVFYLMASTIDPDSLIEEIKYELSNMGLSEKTFNRIKKVWIANEVKIFDNVSSSVYNLYDDIIQYGKIIPNKVSIIRDMKIDKLHDLASKIDFDNISIVKMMKDDM